MVQEDDFDKRVSLRFLQTLNRHLPTKKRALKELLLEDRPVMKNRDSTFHFFDKKELEKLASIIPEHEHRSLRLPINLEMSSSMERGMIRVSGRLECRVINSILDEEKSSGKILKETRNSMIIYYPHLPKIRKELSTTTQFMFTF